MNWRTGTALLVAALALLATGCGGDGGGLSIEEPEPPVGEPMMPDIAPGPPQDAHMTREEGRWLVRFSTILFNIGEGDFVLRATRGLRNWEVDQDVLYTDSGAKVYRTPARLVWGGDGHDHWHVERVAVGRLVPYGTDGRPPGRSGGVADTKVGFCYYDYSRLLDDSVQEAVYSRLSCGAEDDTAIGMGLSWGWADLYAFGLPGQSIDVTDLPDGKYRLWIEVDRKEWFEESTRANNASWSDLELVTKPNGKRQVQNLHVGPPVSVGS